LLPAELTFVAQDQTSGPAFVLSNSGNQVQDTIASLSAGTSAVITVTATLGAAVPDGTIINNTPTIASDTSDPDGSNNSATAMSTVSAAADLGVTISAPATVTAGDTVVYTINVTNSGPSDAQNVVLADSLPAGLTLVSQSQPFGPAFTLDDVGDQVNN